MMEVMVTTGAISRAKLQSNHHQQQTNTQFFTGRMPFLSPNQQCQSAEAKNNDNNKLTYLKAQSTEDFHKGAHGKTETIRNRAVFSNCLKSLSFRSELRK